MTGFKENATGLMVPAAAFSDQRISTCRCGDEFRLPEERSKLAYHVSLCVRQADDLKEEIAEREENFAPLDPEQWDWGRQRIAAGKRGFHRGQAA